MPTPEVIAVGAPLSAELLQAIRQTAPNATLLGPAELKQDREAIRRAEVLYTHHVRPERLRDAGKLRWIQTLGAGVEWLLVPEIVSRDLLVTNASGVHAEPIAEHVFGLILALARRLPQVLAQQREHRWDSAPFREGVPTLSGSTLAILGIGAIGGHIAAVGSAFGMRVIGTRRSGESVPHVERVYRSDQLREVLAQAHYVVNALPLTAATRHAIGAAELGAMRPDAVLINIGRGGTIDTDALVVALRERRIAGAGLDVTDPEPLPSDHPLWSLDNAIVTPHFSGGRPGYVERVTDIFLENLRRYQAGEPLTNVVDLKAGY